MGLELPKNFDRFVEDDFRREIKLADFSKIFFPMFVAKFSGENVEIGRWLLFTNTNGHQWVDIMDKGDIVFSVPPILQSIAITSGNGLDSDPGEILNIAKLKDAVIPGAGNQHIRQNITDKLDLTEDNLKGTRTYMDNWIPIFEYYGYTLGDGGSEDSSNSSENDYQPGTFDDYDEF